MIIECPGCRSRYDVTGRAPGTKARCRCNTVFEIEAAPSTAGHLGCPKCGASANPHDPSCHYCGTALALAGCPRCFARIFAGSRHCGHCGARIDEPARAADLPSSRRCPRCPERPALLAQLVGDALLDQCPSCTGVFVDTATIERVVADRDQQARLGTALTTVEGGPIFLEQKVTYLPCPDCGNLMLRNNFGKRSGVITDQCKAHGMWFDADELRRVVQFVHSGGLDEARRREIEELERKISAKRNQVVQTPRSTYEARTTHNDVLGDLLGAIVNLLR